MQIVYVGPGDATVPRSALLARAVALQNALADSELRLFDDTITQITPSTTAAQLNAAQAVFTGYTAGGTLIEAFNEPTWDAALGGYVIYSPLVQFNRSTSGGDVTGVVGGAYLVNGDDGGLEWALKFEDPISMEEVDQSIPIVVGLLVK